MADNDSKINERRKTRADPRVKDDRDPHAKRDRREPNWVAHAATQPRGSEFWKFQGRRKPNCDAGQLDRREVGSDRRVRVRDRRGDPSFRPKIVTPRPNRRNKNSPLAIAGARSGSTRPEQVAEIVSSGMAARPQVTRPASQSSNAPAAPERLRISEVQVPPDATVPDAAPVAATPAAAATAAPAKDKDDADKPSRRKPPPGPLPEDAGTGLKDVVGVRGMVSSSRRFSERWGKFKETLGEWKQELFGNNDKH